MSDTSFDNCPPSAPFFGFMGVAAALVFASKNFFGSIISFLLTGYPHLINFVPQTLVLPTEQQRVELVLPLWEWQIQRRSWETWFQLSWRVCWASTALSLLWSWTKDVRSISTSFTLTVYLFTFSLVVESPTEVTGQTGGATTYSSFPGFAHLAAGLCCGLRYGGFKWE